MFMSTSAIGRAVSLLCAAVEARWRPSFRPSHRSAETTGHGPRTRGPTHTWQAYNFRDVSGATYQEQGRPRATGRARRVPPVTGEKRAPWLFVGTGLRDGESFGHFVIEVDATSKRTPRGTFVLARITDIFGKGNSAEMTYYQIPAGAKVFSAGVLNFAGSLQWQPMAQLMENLWRRLSVP